MKRVLASHLDRGLSWLIRGRDRRASHVLLAPATVWLAVFLVLPLAWLIALSFIRSGPYGSFIWSFNLQNYARALDAKYLPVVLRTLAYAGAATGLCLLLGFPLAYFISFYAGRWKDRLLILLMIPFWTSSLVAIYCWMIILGQEGLLNSLLMTLRLIDEPLNLLNTPFAVILGLAYFYLPFMVLPLYGSLEKIPRNYLEASYDLGAGAFRTFFKVTLPLSLPGVVAGCILTFVPCLGDFLTASFLGGPDSYLLGNLIENQFLMGQDWPFGAALTALLLVCMAGGMALYRRLEAQESWQR
ncbi:MAG: ABC transporter permease [Elusimicrobia bacterium]|nr:ABC transporter permease [Elusimicrobiota bacterium]